MCIYVYVFEEMNAYGRHPLRHSRQQESEVHHLSAELTILQERVLDLQHNDLVVRKAIGKLQGVVQALKAEKQKKNKNGKVERKTTFPKKQKAMKAMKAMKA